MSTPVADASNAVVAALHPARLPLALVETGVIGKHLRRSAPLVPVELGGNRLRRKIANPGTRQVRRDDARHLADRSASNQGAAVPIGDRRTLLTADLHDAAVPAGRLDHPPPLDNAQGHRLL